MSCAPQSYSSEALRYEMEGSVQLAFTLDKDGAPVEPRVRLASDYALLSRDAIAYVKSCKFAIDTPAGAPHTMTVNWRLPQGRPEVAPKFLPRSCLNKYKALTPSNPEPDKHSLTVRMQVWPDGQAYTPKIERSSGEPDLDRLARNYVENCRFEPALRDGKPVRGAALLTLPTDPDVFSEAKVRSAYDREVARLSQSRDYKVAHILYASVAAAREAIAEVQSGQPFGAIARRESMDQASGKVDGELGWVRPGDMVAPFSAALRARDKPGLIEQPVHTQFGWHVIQIGDARPTAIPQYELVHERLRSMLLKETDIVVRLPPAPATTR